MPRLTDPAPGSDPTGAAGDFGARLAAAAAARGPLCAGIDPHPNLLAAWGHGDDPAGLERFARHAAEVIAPEVALVKPQSAFFERHGARGVAVLEQVIGDCREAGALVLLDVKRGDIGSTMGGYADAYLEDGSPLAADAITVSPYLGVGALEPAFERAGRTGRGVFVLALTSNPEGRAVQAARVPDRGRAGAGEIDTAGDTGTAGGGGTVAQAVVDAVAARNAGRAPMGSFGVVVGATTAPGAVRLDRLGGPVLAPGVGAQGAAFADLVTVFGETVRTVFPAMSRELLRHGPEPDKLRKAVRSVVDEARRLRIPLSGQVDGGTPR